MRIFDNSLCAICNDYEFLNECVICPYKEEREARALELEYEELEVEEVLSQNAEQNCAEMAKGEKE